MHAIGMRSSEECHCKWVSIANLSELLTQITTLGGTQIVSQFLKKGAKFLGNWKQWKWKPEMENGNRKMETIKT